MIDKVWLWQHYLAFCVGDDGALNKLPREFLEINENQTKHTCVLCQKLCNISDDITDVAPLSVKFYCYKWMP